MLIVGVLSSIILNKKKTRVGLDFVTIQNRILRLKFLTWTLELEFELRLTRTWTRIVTIYAV